MTLLGPNPSRVHLTRRLSALAAQLPPGARVLDAGAGDARHGAIFARQRYLPADLCRVPGKQYGRLELLADASRLPLRDGVMDAVLCTQVLAHVTAPDAVVRELFRVARPGATLLLTAPLFFQENEPPHDYQRFTRFGLTRLLTLAGWEIERLDWLEGYAGTVAYQLRMAARCLPARPSRLGGGALGLGLAALVTACRPALLVLAEGLARADLRAPVTDVGMCKNHVVIARRPLEVA